MYASLVLEWWPQHDRIRILRYYAPDRKPWVARITGWDERYQLAREFLEHRMERGPKPNTFRLWYLLREGEYYDVYAHRTLTDAARYFCTVRDGAVVRCSYDEVAAWLHSRARGSDPSASMS